MAKITVKELESLTANDAGRILREDGNLAGRISLRKDGVSVSFFYRYRWGVLEQRIRLRILAMQIPDGYGWKAIQSLSHSSMSRM